jgi:hypothetical protein
MFSKGGAKRMQEKTKFRQINVLGEPSSYLPTSSQGHRAVLNAGVASRAIIALPAAFSFGVVLSSTARPCAESGWQLSDRN